MTIAIMLNITENIAKRININIVVEAVVVISTIRAFGPQPPNVYTSLPSLNDFRQAAWLVVRQQTQSEN